MAALLTLPHYKGGDKRNYAIKELPEREFVIRDFEVDLHCHDKENSEAEQTV